MTAAGEWRCPACARSPEPDGPLGQSPCQQYGCGAAGRTPPKPVWVDADALARQAESFVGRRSVLPAVPPAGVTAAEAAHMRGDCNPRTCARCVMLREMRGETG